MNLAQIGSVRMQAVQMVKRVGGSRLLPPNPQFIPQAEKLLEKLNIETALLNGEYTRLTESIAHFARVAGRPADGVVMLHDQHTLSQVCNNIDSLEKMEVRLSIAIRKAKQSR
jgi:hypothetical protein